MVAKKKEPKSCFYYLVVFIVCMIPIGLLTIGAVSMIYANARGNNIIEYNRRAKEWNKHGRTDFANKVITGVINGERHTLMQSTKIEGEFYPVRDSCHYDGDPDEGCVETSGLYYYTRLNEGAESYQLELSQNDRVFLNTTVSSFIIKAATVRELDCGHNPKKCVEECMKIHGEWDKHQELCNYRSYLHNICYRVNIDEKQNIILDQPSGWNLDTANLGCSFSNDWEPAEYTVHNVTGSYLIIRYYQDSSIAASYTTKGCSDKTIKESQCMGLTHKEASWHGFTFTVLSIVITAVLLVVMSIVNCIRRLEYPEEVVQPLV